jgi:hypothetical protein
MGGQKVIGLPYSLTTLTEAESKLCSLHQCLDLIAVASNCCSLNAHIKVAVILYIAAGRTQHRHVTQICAHNLEPRVQIYD